MRYGVIGFMVVCYIVYPLGTTDTWRPKRLASGNLVTRHKYPWVVSVISSYTTLSNGSGERAAYTCTESIIDTYGTVLTASHCVFGTKTVNSKTYMLQFVDVTWGSVKSLTNTRGVRENTSVIFRHPGSYAVHQNPYLEDYDIALIFLTPFGLSLLNCSDRTVKPITLFKVDGLSNPSDGVVAGFGRQPKTDKYRVITGYTDGDNMAELLFKYGGRGIVTYNGSIYYNESVRNSSMFYAFGLVSQNTPFSPTSGLHYSGICSGDSGGPYMVENDDGQVLLRGMTQGSKSYRNDTNPCCPENKENHFMDMNDGWIRKWIDSMLAARYDKLGVEMPGDIPRVCPGDG